MSELEKRFDIEIENKTFTAFEMKGFMVQPKLALKAGMAIGYLMALEDCASQQSNAEGGEKIGPCAFCGSIGHNVETCTVKPDRRR